MKNTLLSILLGVFGAVTIVLPAFAATSISFAPVRVSVRQGQVLTLTIGVDPQGVKNYSAKTEVHYPADRLEVASFTFANGWIALSQSGYDLTDNTKGVLIKTAGYPGGTSLPIAFGTISFLAKKSGDAMIILDSSSFALDANNQNVLADTAVQTAVAIAALPAQVQTIPTAPTSLPNERQPAAPEERELVAQQQPTALQPIASPSLLASAIVVVTLGTHNTIVGILVTLMVLGFVGYALFAVVQNTRGKNLRKLG